MSGPPIAERLVAMVRWDLDLFHDGGGEAWAWDGTDAFRIGSAAFAERIGADFFERTGKVSSQTSLSTAANTLRGLARWQGPEIPVGLRIAGHGGQVVVDLADPDRQVVVIDANGWTITEESPVRFHRPPGIQPHPMPVSGGSLEDLGDIWPIDGDELVLVLGWLLGCLNPTGVKPILDLSGTQGSGKSLLATMLRSLVDPNAIALQTMPTDLRNLAVIAARHALPTFDNVSVIGEELSDALCRLVTPGTGFEVRRLYTDDDVVTFTATRPVLLTGIPEVAKQPDLVDRTIAVTLRGIPPGEHITEDEIAGRFESLRPVLLGVLFDAVACAIANQPATVLREVPRMADFATWVEAGAPAFGWEPQRFLDAYLANRADAAAGIVEGSFIGQFIPDLADQGFVGTAKEALAKLALIAGTDATRHRAWPGSPRGFRNILDRLKPALAAATGVVVEFVGRTGHDRRRIIRIFRADDGVEGSGTIVTFTKASQADRPMVEEAVRALRAVGVDATWAPTKAATVAMLKAAGKGAVAVAALNVLGLPGPDGGPWTVDGLRGVV
jgi:putative DNA primase/helicase